jgi:signal transduction histidine kinase
VESKTLDPLSESVLILAPTGQDAKLVAGALKREGISPEIFDRVAPLCERMRRDSGAILIAEEVLTKNVILDLNHELESQAPWSDIPLVVMTGGGVTTQSSIEVIRAFSPSGNVTLIERPFRPITLVSALRVALRARRRQYQVRGLMLKQLDATRARDEFLSIASHELKTPLTSLKLQIQMNQRLMQHENPDAFSPERVRKLVETTDRQVDRLGRLVEDMLDVARVHTGKLTMEKSQVDLTELVREVIERISPQLSAAKCEIREKAEVGILGNWDRYRIEQVINNLLTNAIRYSPGKPIHIVVSKEGEKARLTVHDEGAGISPENHERIFQRFERAVSSGNISGLGLGLYISRQILESHQGTIHVESVPNEGATFIVELPLSA